VVSGQLILSHIALRSDAHGLGNAKPAEELIFRPLKRAMLSFLRYPRLTPGATFYRALRALAGCPRPIKLPGQAADETSLIRRGGRNLTNPPRRSRLN